MESFNLTQWLAAHRSELEPPLTNKVIWGDAELMVIIAVGPHVHADYHVNPFEEFFYQLNGNTELDLVVNGKPETKTLRQGDVLLLPPCIPHSPQRPDKESVTLVVERRRPEGLMDAFEWYCKSCHRLAFRQEIHRSRFAEELASVWQAYHHSASRCASCGALLPQ
jgi:3-hydroxyanthranilate 3,4-dioxygenase